MKDERFGFSALQVSDLPSSSIAGTKFTSLIVIFSLDSSYKIIYFFSHKKTNI